MQIFKAQVRLTILFEQVLSVIFNPGTNLQKFTLNAISTAPFMAFLNQVPLVHSILFLHQKEDEAKDQSSWKGLEFPRETRRANAEDSVRKRAPRTSA